MLQYKGAYDSSSDYGAGSVVVFTDGIAYSAFKDAPAGTGCHDTHYWERLAQPTADIVTLFHGMLSDLKTSTAIADSVILDANTLILGVEGSDDKYAVTVDASGDTPDLAVAEVDEVSDD